MNNNPIPSPTFGEQNDVLELFVWLALEQPQLSLPYMTFARYSTPYVNVSVSHGDFEAWRQALGFDAAEVRLRSTETYSFLDIEGVYSRSLGRREVSCRVVLSGSGLPVLPERPAEDPNAPGPWGDPIAYGPTGVRCGCGKDAHSNLVPCRTDSPEDPHDSPLHTDYAVPHDLPAIPHQQDRRWA